MFIPQSFNHTMPKITVFMPVYNGEKYIKSAINSVLNQTFSDFILLIVDDGSTDSTEKIIKSFADARIAYIKRTHNYVDTLNYALENIQTKYIARMDADDIMPCDRIRIQTEILDDYPQIDVCGGFMQVFGDQVKTSIIKTFAGYIKNPLLHMLKGNIIFNPTTMFRMDFINKNKIRYKSYPYAEDMKFWCDAIKCGASFFIESQVLNYYRSNNEQITKVYNKEQSDTTITIQKELIEFWVNQKQNTDIITFYNSMIKLNKRYFISDNVLIKTFFEFIAEYDS